MHNKVLRPIPDSVSAPRALNVGDLAKKLFGIEGPIQSHEGRHVVGNADQGCIIVEPHSTANVHSLRAQYAKGQFTASAVQTGEGYAGFSYISGRE